MKMTQNTPMIDFQAIASIGSSNGKVPTASQAVTPTLQRVLNVKVLKRYLTGLIGFSSGCCQMRPPSAA